MPKYARDEIGLVPDQIRIVQLLETDLDMVKVVIGTRRIVVGLFEVFQIPHIMREPKTVHHFSVCRTHKEFHVIDLQIFRSAFHKKKKAKSPEPYPASPRNPRHLSRGWS